MEDVQDEPLAAERVAGIDIGMATIRVPGAGAGGHRRQEAREFGTTRRELLALAAWLREWDVDRAGMEATSDTGSRSCSPWSARALSACSTRRRG